MEEKAAAIAATDEVYTAILDALTQGVLTEDDLEGNTVRHLPGYI